MIDKEKFIDTYNNNKNEIQKLYTFGCLVSSGFDNDKAYELKDLLLKLWLKDSNCSSISTLSDMLYENYDKLDIKNMSLWDMLEIMYESV